MCALEIAKCFAAIAHDFDGIVPNPIRHPPALSAISSVILLSIMPLWPETQYICSPLFFGGPFCYFPHSKKGLRLKNTAVF